MDNIEAAIKAAKTQDKIAQAEDRGEDIGLMEPLVLSDGSRHRPALNDLAIELATASAGLRRSLPDGVITALSDLVRAMNCYYSNLIEGHDTHPIDIERALKKDYSADPEQRNLQLEAEAHVTVQQWIDDGGLKGRATTTEAILEIHRRFCELLPPELLVVEHSSTREKLPVVPGRLREHDVDVGSNCLAQGAHQHLGLERILIPVGMDDTALNPLNNWGGLSSSGLAGCMPTAR